jgi:spore germination protein YaaH
MNWKKLAAGITTIGLLAVSLLAPEQGFAADKKFNMSYLYFNDPSTYVSQVNDTRGSLNVVAPNYFDLNTDGTLKITWKLQASFVSEMHKRGIKVVPYITSHWDLATGRAAMKNRAALAAQVADAVTRYGLDGVNVDIEGLQPSERDAQTDFLRLLREKMPGKEVSIAVAANPSGWTDGWQGSYDYGQLAKYADYLMVMAYDENYDGDVTPGPVGSLPWVEKSIQYALNKGVPANKIVLGLPYYGRYWKSDGSIKGAAITHDIVDKVIAKVHATVSFDGASQTPKATFTVKAGDPTTVIGSKTLTPGTYTMWYDDERSIKAKLRLVQKYNLKGTGSWALSQEDTDMWSYYSMWLNGNYFTDAQNHWARDSILAMVDKGWMLGTSSTQFSPEGPLTRAQAAVILVRAMGLDQSQPASSAPFADVPANNWAAKEIAIAKERGYVDGVGDGMFSPNVTVTRDQISKMLARILGYTPTATASPFADVTPDMWSYEFVLAMQQHGVINGFEDGLFHPERNTTRAQMATLMNRIAAEIAARK